MEDMREKGVVNRAARILTEIADRGVSDSPDLWPSISSRLSDRQRRPNQSRRLLIRRVVLTAMVLGAFLALAGVAYAAAPIVGRFFGLSEGAKHVGEAGLAQDVEVSRTLDGLTVTVEYAYVDANQAMVGLAVDDRSGRTPLVRVAWLGLADDENTVFHWSFAEAPCFTFGEGRGGGCSKTVRGPGSDQAGPPLGREPASRSSWWAGQAWQYAESDRRMLGFDIPPLPERPDRLALRLVLHLQLAASRLPSVDEVLDLFVPPPTAVPGPAREYLVGPFVFELDVPFVAGATVEVHRTVEAAGVRLTLEEVVVTPSQTRVVLRSDPPDTVEDLLPLFLLETPAGEVTDVARRIGAPALTRGDVSSNPGRGTWVVVVPEYLGDQHGQWTLTVHELVDPIRFMASGQGQGKLGPWVFEFEVP